MHPTADIDLQDKHAFRSSGTATSVVGNKRIRTSCTESLASGDFVSRHDAHEPLAPEPDTRPPGNNTQSACDTANPTDVTAGGSGVTAFGCAELIHSEADDLGENAALIAPQQPPLQPVQPAATATRQQRVADDPADATQPLLAATELRQAEDPRNEAEVCPECGCYTHNTHSTPV